MKDRSFDDLQRRGFLVRCCELAGALLLPYDFSVSGATFSQPEFHFHPSYRERTALDAAVLQIKPGADGFPSETYHDTLAAVLSAWSGGLLSTPISTEAIASALDDSFCGSSWQPAETHPLRTGSNVLQVRLCRFPTASLNRATFLAGLKTSIAPYSKFVTAEFQVTRIDITPTRITTQVRYELVGSGQAFHREARAGEWTLEWKALSGGTYKVNRWEAREETRSRSLVPLFSETTDRAFADCPSFRSQMLQGVDHWRTTLDGACGIDIYGHNGISVGDIDGAGRDSIYVCQPAGLPNRLYRNRGDGTFEDVTQASGLGLLDNTACALFLDLSDSGRQDIVVVRASGPLLFLNDGKGRFHLKEGAFRFATPPQGTFTGAAAADYDRDGRLDIYFCLYTFYQGANQYRYPTPYFAAENGPPNFLMHNNGDGTFRDVTAACGLDKNNTRYSFCCAWGDSNGDGWPDLYVVNDFGRKNLYRNKGNGTFTDIAAEAGVDDTGAGMSVCWLDYNNDGAQDLYVANMWTAAGERIANDFNFQKQASPEIQALYHKHAMGNSLFRNRDNRIFDDQTEHSSTRMGRWSWSSDAWDFDHDGFADLYVTNGMISGPLREDLNSFFWRQVVAKSPNIQAASAEYEGGWNAINEMIRSGYSWSGYERNVVYANNRDGTFADVSGALGIDFDQDSRSFALADFDGDGRQEMLLKNRNAPQLRLISSVIPDLPPAIAFRLRGTASNRDAIGAKIVIETNAGRQTRYLQAGSGFLAQHSKELFFGLGQATGTISATITWPSGRTQHLTGLPANHRILVTEGLEATHFEPFEPLAVHRSSSILRKDSGAGAVGTWLLCPISAPDFGEPLLGKPALLCFSTQDLPRSTSLRIISINAALQQSSDITATYNLLFRYLFDAHRDLPLPVSFLIDAEGQIIKVYAGGILVDQVQSDLGNIPKTSAERLRKALPFPGIQTTYEYGRNYLSLGSIFYQRGYIEAARGFFESALKNDPSSAEAYYGLGSVFLKQNNEDGARDCFEKAVRLKPAYPETEPNAWNNLGLLATRGGNTEGAINYFQKALQFDPGHLITLQNLGNAYRQEKRWDDARTTLERAVAIKPDSPEANYGLGMVYAQQDDTARAYYFLQKALQQQPDYPEALNNLGILYLRTQRPQEAVATFEKCIRVAPSFDQSYLNLARVYAIEGDPEKARGILNALLAQHPNHVLAKQALAQLSQ